MGAAPSMESMALFDKILGVHEKDLKCEVCNGYQVCTSKSAHLEIFQSFSSDW